MNLAPLATASVLAATLASGTVDAQPVAPQPPAAPQNVLALDATVHTEVIPDLAYVTLAAEAQGADAAPITRTVQQAINAALAEAKGVAGVEARTGAFSTQQRWNNKGTRDGWTVRGELVIKSRDFAVLGTLAGKLAQQKLMIVNTGFELSTELREREEQALITQGIKAFRSKAQTATQAFGFSRYTLREVRVDSISGGAPAPQPRMYAMAAAAKLEDSTPMAIEGGSTKLSLTVGGSVLMGQ